MSASCQLKDVLAVANQLGEAVIWDHREQRLLWTDILNRCFYNYDPDTNQLNQITTPERLTAFGLTPERDVLIAAFAGGIHFYNPWQATRELIYSLPDTKELRLNDGRVDRRGQFWVGGMIENSSNASPLTHKQATLYRVDGQQQVTPTLGGIRISNSLCWSPDGLTAYFSDSPRNTIWAFDVDPETGNWTNRRIFAETEAQVHPDGATVDSQGFLWCALWGAGEVARFAPSGERVETVKLPVSQPTCVAFGGEELRTLFVTSARCDLDEATLKQQPQAGHVFVFDSSVSGLPEECYQPITPIPTTMVAPAVTDQ
ncbi:SMP-30/gluconolactonase/LRE family protein [Microbulbifer agarilyticus]